MELLIFLLVACAAIVAAVWYTSRDETTSTGTPAGGSAEPRNTHERVK